jgi:hypothetical protein
MCQESSTQCGHADFSPATTPSPETASILPVAEKLTQPADGVCVQKSDTGIHMHFEAIGYRLRLEPLSRKNQRQHGPIKSPSRKHGRHVRLPWLLQVHTCQ